MKSISVVFLFFNGGSLYQRGNHYSWLTLLLSHLVGSSGIKQSFSKLWVNVTVHLLWLLAHKIAWASSSRAEKKKKTSFWIKNKTCSLETNYSLADETYIKDRQGSSFEVGCSLTLSLLFDIVEWLLFVLLYILYTQEIDGKHGARLQERGRQAGMWEKRKENQER